MATRLTSPKQKQQGANGRGVAGEAIAFDQVGQRRPVRLRAAPGASLASSAAR